MEDEGSELTSKTSEMSPKSFSIFPSRCNDANGALRVWRFRFYSRY